MPSMPKPAFGVVLFAKYLYNSNIVFIQIFSVMHENVPHEKALRDGLVRKA